MAQTGRRPNWQRKHFLQVPINPRRMAPTEAVRWVLHFVDQDIGALSEARVSVLAEDALALMGGHGAGYPGPRVEKAIMEWVEKCQAGVSAERVLAFMKWGFTGSLHPPARKTLLEWQAVVRDRLARYFTAEGWPFAITLAGIAFGPCAAQGKYVRNEIPWGREPEVFSWYVLQEILALGDRFRRCQNPACRAPFVAQGRQAFCNIRCGNQIRVARFREERNKDPKKRAAYLAQRKKAHRKRARAKIWAQP